MQLQGSITALLTPFTPDGALDRAAWRRSIERQIEGGTQGLVVAGSTGEAAALADAEFEILLRDAVEIVARRIPVLAGTGLSATAKTVARTRQARNCGADAALVVTPPYVRPTQEGLCAHYLEVADQGNLPVVLYNVPTRTGVDLLPATVARLCGHPGIIGIKEARAEPERMTALLALRRPDFTILSGDDGTACAAMLNGADGCISVASNAAPRAFRRLCDLARAGAESEARAADTALQALFGFLGVEPNPVPAKALLGALGIMEDRLRLPLLPLSTTHRGHCLALASEIAMREASLATEEIF